MSGELICKVKNKARKYERKEQLPDSTSRLPCIRQDPSRQLRPTNLVEIEEHNRASRPVAFRGQTTYLHDRWWSGTELERLCNVALVGSFGFSQCGSW